MNRRTGPGQPARALAGRALAGRALAGLGYAVAGFHLVKLAGLVSNLRAFPVLGTRPDRAARSPRTRSDGAPSPRTPSPRTALPRTSLLVPARDEAARLPRSLPGLLAQPAAEILVLDDGSGDGTAEVVRRAAAADPRLRLLTGTPPPAGWVGKNWACQQLAEAATGELLVFCDADVRLAPGALAAAWAEQARTGSDLFSVFPRQHAGRLGERLLVPLIDETLLGFLPHRLLTLPVPAAATANGQFLAFRRAAYRALGGHAAVAGQIVEDVALARLARRRGLRLGLALGGDLVGARMYEGYRQTVAGLGKSLRAAHGGSDLLLAASAGWHLAAYTLPWLALLPRQAGPSRRAGPSRGSGQSGRSGQSGAALVAWRLAALAGPAARLLANAKTGRRAWPEALLVPVTAPAALPVYLRALRRTAVWKGRRYR